jgi:nicotinate-nucleotide pyrophosphorylase
MSTVEEIERAVEQLRPPDFARFAAWVERKRTEEWDRQIEADAKAGQLDKFIDEALSDLREGRTTRLP